MKKFWKVLPWALVVALLVVAIADRLIMTRTVVIWKKTAYHFAIEHQKSILPGDKSDEKIIYAASDAVTDVLQEVSGQRFVPHYAYEERVQREIVTYYYDLETTHICWGDRLAAFVSWFTLGLR